MDAVHLLVLPEREDAEAVAAELADLLAEGAEPPRIHRDALAGDDDPEDAQWVVEMRDIPLGWDAAALEELVAAKDGWYQGP